MEIFIYVDVVVSKNNKQRLIGNRVAGAGHKV